MLFAISQINPIIGDFSSNLDKIIAALKEAHKKKCALLVFPECALCGYPPEDLLSHQSFGKACEEALFTLLPHTKGMTVVLGLPRQNPDPIGKSSYNSAAIIQDGKVLGYQDKSLLPTYSVFDEARYFAHGEPHIKKWKLGDLKFGVMICEDAWTNVDPHNPEQNYAKSPLETVNKGDLDLIINISASPFTHKKRMQRLENLQPIAQRLACPLLMANQVGAQDSLIFDGGSLALDPAGEIVVEAKAFEEDFIIIDSEDLSKQKLKKLSKEENLYKALVLGIQDYFQKQGLQRAFIGISGGIDSALTAALAVDALGRENVEGVMMPSPYTSEESIKDAEDLCKRLGMFLHTVEIKGLFDHFLEELKPHFDGMPPDVTEENIQARIRGNLLMALANKHRGIVLATGNKSELAMGYCTLYGDLCGGLAVLNDLWKTEVYALCEYINQNEERIPLSILKKAPSAELKPDQKDQDTLPEYALLDAVLKAYIEEKASIEEIALRVGEKVSFVQKIVSTIHKQEFKRRQAPMGLIVSDQAFTYGYRYPIVQKWIT